MGIRMFEEVSRLAVHSKPPMPLLLARRERSVWDRCLLRCLDVAQSQHRRSNVATRNRRPDIETATAARGYAGSKRWSRFKYEICGSSMAWTTLAVSKVD